MEFEPKHHLGYEKSITHGKNAGNSCNGKPSKTIKGDFGEVPIDVPRGRNGEFNLSVVKKHRCRREAAIFSLLYLSLINIMKKWTMPLRDGGKTLHQFAVLYGVRIPQP